MYTRLGWPKGRSGQVQKISTPLGFNPRTVQPVASRYTDYATWPTCQHTIPTLCSLRQGRGCGVCTSCTCNYCFEGVPPFFSWTQSNIIFFYQNMYHMEKGYMFFWHQPYNINNSLAALENTPCNQTIPVWFTHSPVTHWKWLATDKAQSNVSRSEIHI